MKAKVITFLCSLGIPISALTTQNGCTGICGSCQMTCFPGVFALVILAVKYLYKRYLWRLNSI